MRLQRSLSATMTGLAGGIAWWLGIRIFFGPAQALLTDPARQSAKMLGVFGLDPPAPLVALELACWAGVMLSVGVTIAGVDRGLEALGLSSPSR